MKLKTYRAPSMADALGLVKKDLGKDAVILHTRSVKVGGVLGFGAKTLVEITASDESVPMARQRKTLQAAAAPSTPPAPPTPFTSAQGVPLHAGSSPGPALPVPAGLNAYRKAVAATGASSQLTEPKPVPTPATRATDESHVSQIMTVRNRRDAGGPLPKEIVPDPRIPTYRPPEAGDHVSAPPVGLQAQIQRELADIKLLVNQVLHAAPASSAGAAAGQMPPALFDHYLRLLNAAVSRDLADRIIGAVRDELNPGELGDATIVRATVLRHIAGLIPVSPGLPAPTAGAGPTVIALVGPTGVGKTTTIAKLAASYKLRQGKTVGLITSDTYRIAAVDQLRTYAGIIGLPLRVVLTPEEMGAAVAGLSHLDVILIDTAGRSQFNADRIEELRAFLEAAAPTEVHLVLSTTASEPVLLKTAEAFAALRPDRVILTKLDEAVNFGVVLNVAQRVSAQLSFVTTGQEVPDHLEPGHPDRLARMVLDNRLVAAARHTLAPDAEPVGAARGGL
jgi:flagellar biosynthesis protein FlhF